MFERTFSFWRRLVGRETTPSSQGNEERRLWVRYPADLATVVQRRNGEQEHRLSARVRDISLGGANLEMDHCFEAGQLISLELPLAEKPQSQTVLACIVRVVREKPGLWALGCVFSHELADEDLEGLGSRRVKPEGQDQRTWVRFPTSIKAQYQKVGPLQMPVAARVLNLSASGVGLLVKEKVSTGALLSVDFLDQQDHVVRTMLSCVVHVSPRDAGEWALGCNFIRELSEEDLRSLI